MSTAWRGPVRKNLPPLISGLCATRCIRRGCKTSGLARAPGALFQRRKMAVVPQGCTCHVLPFSARNYRYGPNADCIRRRICAGGKPPDMGRAHPARACAAVPRRLRAFPEYSDTTAANILLCGPALWRLILPQGYLANSRSLFGSLHRKSRPGQPRGKSPFRLRLSGPDGGARSGSFLIRRGFSTVRPIMAFSEWT